VQQDSFIFGLLGEGVLLGDLVEVWLLVWVSRLLLGHGRAFHILAKERQSPQK
jgi:hypothetical protein